MPAIKYESQTQGSHEQITDLSNVVTRTVPAHANMVGLAARTADVNFTLDGTAPTSSKGLLLKAGAGTDWLPVNEGQALKFIQAASSATLDIQYLKLNN